MWGGVKTCKYLRDTCISVIIHVSCAPLGVLELTSPCACAACPPSVNKDPPRQYPSTAPAASSVALLRPSCAPGGGRGWCHLSGLSGLWAAASSSGSAVRCCDPSTLYCIRVHLIHATDMYQSVSTSRETSACHTCIMMVMRCITEYQDLEV